MVEIVETPTPYSTHDISQEDIHVICGDIFQPDKVDHCTVQKLVPPYLFLNLFDYTNQFRKYYQVETLYPNYPITLIPLLGNDPRSIYKNPYKHFEIEHIYQFYIKRAIEIQNTVVKSKHVFFDFSNLYSSIARTELYRLIYHNGLKIKAERIEVLV